jgi:hypothetical protein
MLDVGAGQLNPVKHTVSVQPGTTVYMETEVDEPGQWALHCHLSCHVAAGMFRSVIVEGGPDSTQAASGDQPVGQIPISDFFDAKAGARFDTPEGSDRTYAVLGVAGLAPQWFDFHNQSAHVAPTYLNEFGTI